MFPYTTRDGKSEIYAYSFGNLGMDHFTRSTRDRISPQCSFDSSTRSYSACRGAIKEILRENAPSICPAKIDKFPTFPKEVAVRGVFYNLPLELGLPKSYTAKDLSAAAQKVCSLKSLDEVGETFDISRATLQLHMKDACSQTTYLATLAEGNALHCLDFEPDTTFHSAGGGQNDWSAGFLQNALDGQGK